MAPGARVDADGLHPAEEEVALAELDEARRRALRAVDLRSRAVDVQVRLDVDGVALAVQARASTASRSGRDRSIAPTMVHSSAERIRLLPAEPSASSRSPAGPSTAVGVIIDGIRRPAGTARTPAG